jgi:hypothetical protein
LPREYRINSAGGKEADGEEEAALRPLEPPMGGRRRRHGKPVYRSAKAYLKAQRKQHNRRLRAGVVGKVGR